jgi:hypothetical protein
MTWRAKDPRELDELLARPTQHFASFFIREPALIFGGDRQAADPKSGIARFGPCGASDDQPLHRIRVAIIGTGETIEDAQAWLSRCRSEVDAVGEVDPFLFPSFPGMASESGFNCELDFPDRLVEKLTPHEIASCSGAASRDAAVEAIVKVVAERLDNLRGVESPPDVVLVALPDEVEKAAGGARRPPRRKKRPVPEVKQLAFFDEKRPEPEVSSRTLHRALKGEGMRYGLPTQLAWPRTFKGSDGVQDAATRAWNFCTALYYKAGGMPWRSTCVARSTCYVGISFFRPITESGFLQTSVAQAFSERGEGVVLRGASFQWDRKQGPPRLPRDGARALISGVVDQYTRYHRQAPTRVVVHKSSLFSADEIAGMEDALANVPYFDFLSVARSNIRFLRTGAEPPLRGTAIKVAPQRYIVYTRGYVPFLRLYPGLRIPRPMDVIHAKGSAPVTEVLKELFGLTRMNWNSADFASAEPITLGFSRKIGLILAELPHDVDPAGSFRFYM